MITYPQITTFKKEIIAITSRGEVYQGKSPRLYLQPLPLIIKVVASNHFYIYLLLSGEVMILSLDSSRILEENGDCVVDIDVIDYLNTLVVITSQGFTMHYGLSYNGSDTYQRQNNETLIARFDPSKSYKLRSLIYTPDVAYNSDPWNYSRICCGISDSEEFHCLESDKSGKSVKTSLQLLKTHSGCIIS